MIQSTGIVIGIVPGLIKHCLSANKLHVSLMRLNNKTTSQIAFTCIMFAFLNPSKIPHCKVWAKQVRYNIPNTFMAF